MAVNPAAGIAHKQDQAHTQTREHSVAEDLMHHLRSATRGRLACAFLLPLPHLSPPMP